MAEAEVLHTVVAVPMAAVVVVPTVVAALTAVDMDVRHCTGFLADAVRGSTL